MAAQSPPASGPERSLVASSAAHSYDGRPSDALQALLRLADAAPPDQRASIALRLLRTALSEREQ